MPTEIERKFLVKNDNWKSSVSKEFPIAQGYLNSHPERTTRVRIKGDNGFITIKGKSEGVSRAEFEYEIPKSDVEQMLELCEQPVIIKTRYIIEHAGHIWELDVFEGENEGLIVAEIELKSEDDQFEKPDWVGEEVSGDPKYFNSALIKNPFQSW